jgi:methylmalonyl-CoA mutase N-terminal domain/subunit
MGRRASIKPNKGIYSLEELTKLYKKEKDTRVQERLLAMKRRKKDENGNLVSMTIEHAKEQAHISEISFFQIEKESV